MGLAVRCVSEGYHGVPLLGAMLNCCISSHASNPQKHELFYEVGPDRPTLWDALTEGATCRLVRLVIADVPRVWGRTENSNGARSAALDPGRCPQISLLA